MADMYIPDQNFRMPLHSGVDDVGVVLLVKLTARAERIPSGTPEQNQRSDEALDLRNALIAKIAGQQDAVSDDVVPGRKNSTGKVLFKSVPLNLRYLPDLLEKAGFVLDMDGHVAAPTNGRGKERRTVIYRFVAKKGKGAADTADATDHDRAAVKGRFQEMAMDIWGGCALYFNPLPNKDGTALVHSLNGLAPGVGTARHELAVEVREGAPYLLLNFSTPGVEKEL